jgi:hypothetical protein
MTARIHTHLLFSIGLGAMCIAPCVSAGIAIETAVPYAVGLRPSGVAIGDFNGDGYLDIATSTDTPDKISTLINNGDGTFTLGPVIPLPNSSSPDDLQAGDLDGDGDADLAVILRDLNQVRVVLNNGGTFTLGAAAAIGANAQGMAIADIDSDKDLDLGVANRDSNTATVLRNNGDGTFVSITVPQPVGGEPRGVAFGNFTGSGPLGLAVSNHDTRTVEVFAQTGGTFTQTASLLVGTNDRPDGITAADLNGDGLDDIATVSGDDTPAANRVALFMSTGVTFSNPTYAPTGLVVNSSDIVASDLDCDGVVDLAVTNQDSNNVSLLRNLGGTFAAPVLVGTGTRPGRVNAGDFDNDGDMDLAVANRDSNDISVSLNTCGTGAVVPGDANGDGMVNVTDLLMVISSWGTCQGCPGDVNNDGVVNVADLLLVIANWT